MFKAWQRSHKLVSNRFSPDLTSEKSVLAYSALPTCSFSRYLLGSYRGLSPMLCYVERMFRLRH